MKPKQPTFIFQHLKQFIEDYLKKYSKLSLFVLKQQQLDRNRTIPFCSKVQYIFNYLSQAMSRSYLCLFLLLTTAVILTQQSNYYPLRASYWGSYQFKVMYSGGGSMMGSPTYLYYTVPFITPVTNIRDMSAVLSSYQLAAYPTMLFRVSQPTYNAAAQSATFGVQVVSPSAFFFFRFFVVYNTQLSSSFFEINIKNATCVVANGAIGPSKTETLTSPTRLVAVAGDTFSVEPVLSSILLYNNNQAMQFALTASATPMSGSTLTISLATTSSITEIIVTTFILKTNLSPAEYVFYQNLNVIITKAATSLSNQCTGSFSIPDKNGPVYNQNCSVAVSSLQDDNLGVMRSINFDVTSTGFTSCSNSAQSAGAGTMNIGFSVFCSYQAVCTNASEYYNPPTAGTNNCRPCTDLNSSCMTCNVTTCYTCATGLYPVNNGTSHTCPDCPQLQCNLCLSISTCGSCKNTSYLSNYTCLACTLLPHCVYCSSSTFCMSCVNGYGPDPTGSCYPCNGMIPQCTTCSNYYTCSQCSSNYYVSPGGSSCTSCSYNISNCNSCVNSGNCTGCSTGYFLQANSACISCAQSVPNCSGCTGVGMCTSCSLGYYLINSANCGACTLTGCYNCTGPNVCVNCNTGYYLNGSSNKCQSCKDPHCISCTSDVYCNQCDSDYILNADHNTCSCKIGWPVTKVCTSVVACVTAVKIGNISTCIFCNSMNNFINVNNLCVCQTGYKQSGEQCKNVCGDGITISLEQCDDGNNDDGDGCSASCKREPSFDSCGYNNGLYKCIYNGNFTIKLQYILKSETQNSGTYFFSIQPVVHNLQLMNYTMFSIAFLLSFDFTAFEITSIGYSSGMISVNFDLKKDIQGLDSMFYLSFDPTYFNSSNITYPFSSVGTNKPLIITEYVSHLKYLKMFAYAVLGIAALILLLSSIFQKMIGIETVNVIQIIVFSKLVFVQNDILISGQIVDMKYIHGYNSFGKDLSHTNEVPLNYRRLEFNSDFILNFQTGLILMLISLMMMLILEIYRRRALGVLFRTKKGSADEFKLFQQNMEEKKRFLYQRVFLIVACITLFNCLASIRMQSRSIIGESHYKYFAQNLLGIVFSLIYIFSILAYETLNVGKQHTWIAYYCSYSEHYIGYYLCYILIIAPFLIGGEVFVGIIGGFLITGIALANFIIVLVWRPYKQAFHNFAIIFNNAVLLFVLVVSITIMKMDIAEATELMLAYVMMGLIFLMEIFASVRLYLASLKAPKDNQRINRADEEQLKSGMEKIQQEYLNPHKRQRMALSQTKKEEEDELIKLRNRLKKQFKAKNLDQTQQL